jgi:hypothetical protein
MKFDSPLGLISVLTLCSVSTMALAIGSQALDRQLDSVSRQVEQKTERAIERSLGRRLDMVEQRIEARVEQARGQLPRLPRSLPIHTQQGGKAFNDVRLDDGFRAVERQWLATGTAAEVAELDRPGITILERRELTGLGMILVRFRVAPALDSLDALQAELPGLAEQLDRNHIYAPQSDKAPESSDVALPQWQSLCSAPVRVGMVDTAIALAHPVFDGAQIVQQSFLELAEAKGELAAPTAHGTAVASLMIGRRASHWPARLPGATLFNASVFYGRDQALSGATLGHLLDGLSWLADQEVSVINISLTGPDNRLLNTAIERLNDRGIGLIAAVGNEGPAAAPLYPAAYGPVIGVTAVNGSGELYRWANQGEQVQFAAPGVAVPVAIPEGGMAPDSGTSLAAPVVASALACELSRVDLPGAIETLTSNAQDLGEPGRDTRFGHGLLDY